MAVMEFEHRPHRLWRDPAVVLDQPVDPLRAVGQQIFRGKPRSLMTGLPPRFPGTVSISAHSVQSMLP